MISPRNMRLRVAICVVFLPSFVTSIIWDAQQGDKTTVLTCIGNGPDMKWVKLVNNTEVPIATGNSTHVTLKSEGYIVTSTSTGPNGIRTTLQTNSTDHGNFRCTLGGERQLLSVRIKIQVSSISGMFTLTMGCKPVGIDPPFTTMWFLNSTLVSVVKTFKNHTTTVRYLNTSFTEFKNFTIHDRNGKYEGERPACLTCIVSTNNSFGDATRCTYNTRDISGEKFQQGLLARSVGDDISTNGPPLGSTGSHLVVVTVILVAAIIAAVFIIHLKGKRVRRNYRPTQRIYKQCANSATEVKGTSSSV
uniref:Membrane protein m120.1 n=1 Tax=Mastomys natalensis cytomegalovirus 1 TaxID=2973541 RepID=A0A9Y1N5R1_9BETA|nr:membrane protein m120.1 [Mastomys natalensis cytomegalovirus 1]WEG68974.1 membrane protein m120.1 [Mastomys natalensis cytomegalovirus 1]WEG71202.1 membrane protein m120.1 [Mastomys natalensis cytomegalovirus 1]